MDSLEAKFLCTVWRLCAYGFIERIWNCGICL